MVCEIKIISVIAARIPPQINADSIRVIGTATDCRNVEVTLSCTSSVSSVVPVNVAGDWIVDFFNILTFGCACSNLQGAGARIGIRAVCQENKECQAEQSFSLNCTVSCPSVDSISIDSTLPSCVDASGAVGVTLTAIMAKNGAGTYHWVFSDGQTGSAKTITKNFNFPGTINGTVTFTPSDPECKDSSKATVNFTVPACKPPDTPPVTPPDTPPVTPPNTPPDTPPGTPPDKPSDNGDDGNEDDSSSLCGFAQVAAVVLAALAILAGMLITCIPAAASVLGWLAVGLGVLAIIFGAVVLLFCPKPCGWALLSTAQVMIGVGWGSVFFVTCCPIFAIIGGALLGAGVLMLVAWRRQCRRSQCAVLKEIAYVLTGVVIPIIGYATATPILSACVNKPAEAALGALAAALLFATKNCKG